MSLEQSEEKVKDFISKQEKKTLLSFITCGSVDDGKSTLIGRLLYESKLLYEDQIAALKADSERSGTQGDDIDFALLVDGLASEREQGITIDVAYRYFSTEKRKYIVIDTPGHEQYTRNMATGASQAQLAVLLVDARHGLTTQTRRHSFIVKSLGIKHIVVAINKMDAVDYSEAEYQKIVDTYKAFADVAGIEHFTPIPLSALKGDNVIDAGENMPWYSGPPLMKFLDNVAIQEHLSAEPFRMSVQWVNRPNSDFRGYSGRVNSGIVRKGDRIQVLPTGRQTTVESIHKSALEIDEALPRESVTICLSDEVDVSRGDVLAELENDPEIHNRMEARILWMNETAMRPGQTYLMKLGTQLANATIGKPKYRFDMDSLVHVATDTLGLNEIGDCVVSTDKDIIFERYDDNEALGGFILIDKLSNATVGLGLVSDVKKTTSMQLRTEELTINRELRASQKNQKPVTLWFTGLKFSGKTFIANALERLLYANGNHTIILDPESMWKGISDDLDYKGSDRLENIRRAAHVSKMMNDGGLIVMSCFISAYEMERKICQQIIGEENYFEVFVDTALDVAESRDESGFYDRARKGEIKDFAGVDIAYEPPVNPDLVVSTDSSDYEAVAKTIFEALKERGVISQS